MANIFNLFKPIQNRTVSLTVGSYFILVEEQEVPPSSISKFTVVKDCLWVVLQLDIGSLHELVN